MNSSKKTIGIIVVIIILVVVGILIAKNGSSPAVPYNPTGGIATSSPVASTETTKVSNTLSEYQNAELGFSVKYPSAWTKEEANSGVNFIMPIDKTQVSTVATLQGNIQVLSGTCAFPPVTTIKDRSTLTVGALSLNTISMSNTVQGRTYFNHMYSLQKGPICYIFSFAAITLAASSKNLTGSQATQAANNNKAIIATADTSFNDMVKTFAYVIGPKGVDETKASPAK